MLYPGPLQRQRWLRDAVPAATQGQRCCSRSPGNDNNGPAMLQPASAGHHPRLTPQARHRDPLMLLAPAASTTKRCQRRSDPNDQPAESRLGPGRADRQQSQRIRSRDHGRGTTDTVNTSRTRKPEAKRHFPCDLALGIARLRHRRSCLPTVMFRTPACGRSILSTPCHSTPNPVRY
jgi:hypothetical protein